MILALGLHFISPILVMPGRTFTAKALSCQEDTEGIWLQVQIDKNRILKGRKQDLARQRNRILLVLPCPFPGRLSSLLSQSQLIPPLHIAGEVLERHLHSASQQGKAQHKWRKEGKQEERRLPQWSNCGWIHIQVQDPRHFNKIAFQKNVELDGNWHHDQ